MHEGSELQFWTVVHTHGASKSSVAGTKHRKPDDESLSGESAGNQVKESGARPMAEDDCGKANRGGQERECPRITDRESRDGGNKNVEVGRRVRIEGGGEKLGENAADEKHDIGRNHRRGREDEDCKSRADLWSHGLLFLGVWVATLGIDGCSPRASGDF